MTNTEVRRTLADVQIDDQDRRLLSRWAWYVWVNPSDGHEEVRATAPRAVGPGRVTLLLPRVVTRARVGEYVTNLNGDRLDCRRQNLAVATSMRQVQAGQLPQLGRSSTFKGVDWFAPRGMWRARLAGQHLGLFDTEETAARAYDAAALETFKQFAAPNFPTRAPVLSA